MQNQVFFLFHFQAESDEMYRKIDEYEDASKESNSISDHFDCDIRDLAKRVLKLDTRMEETMEALQASTTKMELAENEFKDKEDDVNAQTRRCLLLEEESRISVEKLATTVMKLSFMSKDADNIVKGCRSWESKTMNNEVEIEEKYEGGKDDWQVGGLGRLFYCMHMISGTDNEMKYDNLARSLAMMEDELKRADERVNNAEARVAVIEEELQSIGENQKQLEISEEKARKREDKYQEQIKQINIRLKIAESRFEYAEMNISKLHLRIDDLEDEIIREKMKINAVSGQLDDTFNEMLSNY